MDTGVLYNAIGLCGVAISLGCYARIQWQRDFAKRMSFSALNGLASVLMLICLSHSWNLASFVSNICWLGFSLYGMWRCFKYMQRDRDSILVPSLAISSPGKPAVDGLGRQPGQVREEASVTNSTGSPSGFPPPVLPRDTIASLLEHPRGDVSFSLRENPGIADGASQEKIQADIYKLH